MKLSELRAREDLDALLPPTLSRGFTAMAGRPTRVSREPSSGAQAWLGQALVSAYFTAEIGRAARRVMADELRYTPRRARAVPQWLAGTTATSRVALRALGRPVFWVAPALEHAESLLVIPGNQRVRILDFERIQSWVLLKDGFAPTAIETEVRARKGVEGAGLPVTSHAPDFTWLVEPLVDGYALPRCPPWRRRESFERRAFELLDAHLERSARSTDAASYVTGVVTEVASQMSRLQGQPGAPVAADVRALVERLAARAARTDALVVADGHGDFQPGNVLVERHTSRVWLIDWECAATRQRGYDALTWGLAARRGRGLAARATRFVDTGRIGGPAPTDHGRAARDARVALFLLEDLAWQGAQALAGRYLRVPSALTTLLDEIAQFLRTDIPR